MEDLLGAHSSVSLWLANQAMDARFELSRFSLERDKYTELSAVNRFLQSVAAARAKYPQRMKNLDDQFSLRRHRSLDRLESDLFKLLPTSGIKDPDLRRISEKGLQASAKELTETAKALFQISEEFSEKIRTFIDEEGV